MKRLAAFIVGLLLPLIAGAAGTIFPYFNTEQDQRFPLTMINSTTTQGPIISGTTPTLKWTDPDDAFPVARIYLDLGNLYIQNTDGLGMRLDMTGPRLFGTPSDSSLGWRGETIRTDYGGTGVTSFAVGDTLYASSAIAAAPLSKLSGNTTTTKKFLTQTGNGSASAAPGWNTIVAGDIESLSPTWSGSHIWLNPLRGANGSATAPTFSYSGDTNNGDYLIGTDNVGTATNGALRMSITSAGNVIVGSSNTAVATSGVVPVFQVTGTSASASSLVYGRWSNDATGAGGLKIVKSRGASVGTAGAVVADDSIGGFNWQADDGTDVTNSAAVIEALIDGPVSTGILPGRLRIRTTNSAGSTADAVTFNSSQQALHANGTAALPTVAFTGSPTSGFYRKAANDVGLSINGTLAWNVTAAGSTTVGSSTASSLIPSGSTQPANGIYLPSANTIGIAAGSTTPIQISSGSASYSNASDNLWSFRNTGGALDEKIVLYRTTGTTHSINFTDDTQNNLRAIMTATRSANAVSTLSFGNATNNPTYTFNGNGLTTHNGPISVTSGSTPGTPTARLTTARPLLVFTETGAGADAGQWMFDVDGDVFNFKTLNDANNSSRNIISVTRSGVGYTDLALGNATSNNTFSFLGTGTSTFSGVLKSQIAVAPTTNTYPLTMASGTPGIDWNETDVTTDQKHWDAVALSSSWRLRALSDDGTTINNILNVSRSGASVSDLTFGNANNPTYTFAGSGTASFSGLVSFNASGLGARTSAAQPRLQFNETDQGTDLKNWEILGNGGSFFVRTIDDASSSGKNAITITRGTTTTVADVGFGNATDNNTTTFSGTGTVTVNGDLKINTAGKGLSVKEGSNAKMGTCTLTAGACVVSTTAVAATSRVFITIQSLGTVAAPKAVGITARTAGTSFTITSADGTDTSVIAWMIVDPS